MTAFPSRAALAMVSRAILRLSRFAESWAYTRTLASKNRLPLIKFLPFPFPTLGVARRFVHEPKHFLNRCATVPHRVLFEQIAHEVVERGVVERRVFPPGCKRRFVDGQEDILHTSHIICAHIPCVNGMTVDKLDTATLMRDSPRQT